MTLPAFFYRSQPQYHARVWGGQHLQKVPAGQTPIGEAWIVHEANMLGGGLALGELARQLGDTFLGWGQSQQFGGRFPLLIKLLDCADWLSVQVYPNDAQARELVGEGEFGKTEVWHFLEAAPGAKILAGVRPGVSAERLAQAIRTGQIMSVAAEQHVKVGDTVFIPAGTLHALGPGLLLYEVQQTSDTTYRVYDWDRPASAGCALHLEDSVRVTRHDLSGEVVHAPTLGLSEAAVVAECPFFRLEVLEIAAGETMQAHTQGQSLHALTLQRGALEVTAQADTAQNTPERLDGLETLLVSAHTGPYTLRAWQDCRVLRASLPALEQASEK